MHDEVTAVVLAGGRATRMGGIDKGLVEMAGRTMCEIVLDILRPQVAEVVINANRNASEYEKFGATVIPDQFPGFLGPLAGLASTMAFARTEWVITAPCDSPLIGKQYVERMLEHTDGAVKVVVARDGQRVQPTFLLAKRELLDDLTGYLEAGERKIDIWYARHSYTAADLADSAHWFINVNTPEARDSTEQLLLNS